MGIGLVAATRTAVALGLCPAGIETRVVNLLQRFGIATQFRGHAPEAVRACMATDKSGGAAGCVSLPLDIGQVVVRDDVPEEVILEVLASRRSYRQGRLRPPAVPCSARVPDKTQRRAGKHDDSSGRSIDGVGPSSA